MPCTGKSWVTVPENGRPSAVTPVISHWRVDLNMPTSLLRRMMEAVILHAIRDPGHDLLRTLHLVAQKRGLTKRRKSSHMIISWSSFF